MSSRSSTFSLVVAFFLAAACSPGDGPGQQGGGSSTGGKPAMSPGSGGGAGAGQSGGSGGASGAAGGAQTGGGGGSPVGGTGGGAGGASAPGGSGGSGTAGSGGAAPADAGAGGEVAPGASVCPEGPFPAPQVGARQNVCGGFNIKYNWNEGPTWSASQKAFFFSNFVQGAAGPGDMIKYDPATGKCETFIVGNGCNGLLAMPDGSVVGACHTPRALMKFDLATKQATVLANMAEGKMLDSPNDLVAHRNGTIYFTNPPFELGGRPQGVGPSVWRRDPAGMVHLITRGNANPIGISPDSKRLYVSGAVWNLDEQGVPTRGGGFTVGGDGVAVDCAGNIYASGGAILSPTNQRIGSFPGGTNSAFGGVDGKTLLVVSGRGVFTVQMNLPGLP